MPVLVEMDGDRRLGTTELVGARQVIGREAADIVFAHPRVSRQHLQLDWTGEGHDLSDLGSSNGTTLNGRPVVGRVQLEDGDLIELGGAIALVYETESDRPAWLIPALGAGGLAVVAALAFAFWPTSDPSWDEAAALAREGLAAARAGRAAEAKQNLDRAFEALYYEGHLDDVPRMRAREEGMRRLGAFIGSDTDLVRVYERAVVDTRKKRVQRAATSAPAGGPCRLGTISRSDLDACVRERTEQVLVALWQDPDRISENFYRAVNEELRLFSTTKRGFIVGSLRRGEPFADMMRARLGEAKVPPILLYLSMIESGYRATAKSHAGARGLWQFMPRTARAYGLKVTSAVDERTDPEKSTRAAAHYLRDLAFEFGGDAMLLAIASYNKGENGVRRALKKLDDPRKDRSYWSLVENDLLPEETAQYVPRLVAAAVLGEAGLPPKHLFD